MARFSVAFTVIVSSSMSAAKRRHQCTVGLAINVSFASGIRNSGGDLRSYSSGGGSCCDDSISDARSGGGDVRSGGGEVKSGYLRRWLLATSRVSAAETSEVLVVVISEGGDV